MAPQGSGGIDMRQDKIPWVQPSGIGSRSQKYLDMVAVPTLLNQANHFEFGTRSLEALGVPTNVASVDLCQLVEQQKRFSCDSVGIGGGSCQRDEAGQAGCRSAGVWAERSSFQHGESAAQSVQDGGRVYSACTGADEGQYGAGEFGGDH